MVALSFYEIFRKWEKRLKIQATNFLSYFICIATVKSLQSSRLFQTILSNCFFGMPALIRKENITCENCGTQTTRNSIVRYKKRCSVGTLCCTQCHKFSTKSQNDLNYHIAKKRSAPKPDITFECKLCFQEFPGFHALRQQRNPQHGMQVGSGTKDVDLEHIVGVIEDRILREQLRSCRHFLVDSELERARYQVFNYAVETLNETTVNEKLDHFFQKIESAAKVNLAFGFILKNKEDGGFRYFYAHQNNTLLDRSKFVCTHDDLAKLKDFLNNTDVIESCSRERMNKVEAVQVNKLDRICCFTQRRTYGEQERSITRTSA